MGRPRLLLAPITVSPTKPLTPTHVKYLLALDVLRRATSSFADVTMLYHHQAVAGSRQISGFWHYLDRTTPGVRYDEWSEQRIGELYVEYNRASPVADEELAATVQAAQEGWTHPASARLLDIWESHYELLGLLDPQLGRTGPEAMGQEEVLNQLAQHNLVVDGRPLGAPIYLDGSSTGLPLRIAISAQGMPNYLLYVLRQLLPQLDAHDQVLFVHDRELRHDYQLLQHIVRTLGVSADRLEVDRVPLGGVVRSARHGDWVGYLLDDLTRPLLDEFGPADLQLGIRLYLLASLGRGAGQSFSHSHLRRWTHRASRLLIDIASDPPADPGRVREWIRGLTRDQPWADPYRLTTTLLKRDRDAPLADLVRGVFTSGKAAVTALDTASADG